MSPNVSPSDAPCTRGLLLRVFLTCALWWVPCAASADLTNVDQATDICGASVDPCVLTQPADIVTGSVLDFGTRGFEVRSNGRLNVGSGTVTVRAGSFTLVTSGTAVSLSGTPSGGALIVETRRRCSGNASLTCLADTQCAAAGAGTCSVGNGAASLGGKIAGNAAYPGAFILRSAGPVGVTQSIQLDATVIDGDGGSVSLDSRDSVTVSALISTDGAAQGAGGEISISAAVDITVTGELDASGGDLDGGVVDLLAGRDILVSQDVSAGATAGGGYGGEIGMEAGRDLRISGGTSSNRVTMANDGHESVDAFGGDGGAHTYSAGRHVSFGQYTRLTSDGAPPDGFGDFISIDADGDVTLDGAISARARGTLGGGGEIDVTAFGQAAVSALSTITLTGSQSGGGILSIMASTGLVFGGDVDVSASNSGIAGDVFFDADGDVTMAGSVKISGRAGRTRHGLTLAGCRLQLSSGSIVANSSESGRNDFTARERITISTGAEVSAPAAGGANVITYRTSAKPPIVAGLVTPAPSLVLDTTLSGCPVCGNREIDAAETCDDGNRAGGDGCSAECQDEGCVAATPGYPSIALCDDGDPCTVDTCDTQRHTCEHVLSCDDGIDCTQDACAGSECVHTPVDALCSSGTVCAAGFCTTTSGCVFTPLSGPCNDGLFCNGSDSCGGGSCSVHTGNPCAGNVECRDLCDESARRCQSPTGTPCTSDGRQCTDDICNGVGSCIHPDRAGTCDDGIFCNGPDACSAGQCLLHAGDPCTGECRETCNEAAQTCGDPQGLACSDDGNFCTEDRCDGQGGCSHAAYRSFSTLSASVVRKPGPINDRFAFKAMFASSDFTPTPTLTGLRFAIADDSGTGIFTCTLPALGFVDVKGDGSQYRFRDTTGTLAGANGVYLALVRRTSDGITVRLKGRDYDVPGIVGKPEVSVALGFDESAGTGSCVAGVTVPCTARGSRVSCKR